MIRLVFEVHGHPEPAGSKRSVGRHRIIDANPNVGPWKGQVSERAAAAMAEAGYVLFDGPLGLAVTFLRIRPQGHFRTGRNAGVVKDSAPAFPIVKPDATKLLRGVEDAMTGVVYRDDAQVVEQFVSKRYGDSEGVKVTVWTL
jgi:Holliday junction resolvase RusA-like endonuclease